MRLQAPLRQAAVLLFGMLLCAPVSANGSGPPLLAPASAAEGRCGALFGSAQHRAKNKSRRRAALLEVKRREDATDLVYTVPTWRAPVSRHLPGMELIAVELDESSPVDAPKERIARLRLDAPWSALCTAGEYRVTTDDALGVDGQVLAVLEDGLLLEQRGELVHVQLQGRPAHPFRMIWQSTFAIRVDGDASGRASSSVRSSSAARSTAATARRARQARTPSPRTQLRAPGQ